MRVVAVVVVAGVRERRHSSTEEQNWTTQRYTLLFGELGEEKTRIRIKKEGRTSANREEIDSE